MVVVPAMACWMMTDDRARLPPAVQHRSEPFCHVLSPFRLIAMFIGIIIAGSLIAMV